MSGKDKGRVLSRDAAAVLKKMQEGLILVGNKDDYGRDFRLIAARSDTWEDVKHSIAKELADAGKIKPRTAKGNQTEYEPA